LSVPDIITPVNTKFEQAQVIRSNFLTISENSTSIVSPERQQQLVANLETLRS